MDAGNATIGAAAITALGAVIASPVAAVLIQRLLKNTRASPRLVVWCSAGAALGIVAVSFLVWQLRGSYVEITDPMNGARVDIADVVRGRSRNLPADRVLRVVVYLRKDERYFPHDRNVAFEANGLWSSQNVSIGSTADAGAEFDILVLLLDRASQEEIDEQIRDREFVGLEQLPNGVEIRDQVTVRRR